MQRDVEAVAHAIDDLAAEPHHRRRLHGFMQGADRGDLAELAGGEDGGGVLAIHFHHVHAGLREFGIPVGEKALGVVGMHQMQIHHRRPRFPRPQDTAIGHRPVMLPQFTRGIETGPVTLKGVPDAEDADAVAFLCFTRQTGQSVRELGRVGAETPEPVARLHVEPAVIENHEPHRHAGSVERLQAGDHLRVIYRLVKRIPSAPTEPVDKFRRRFLFAQAERAEPRRDGGHHFAQERVRIVTVRRGEQHRVGRFGAGQTTGGAQLPIAFKPRGQIAIHERHRRAAPAVRLFPQHAQRLCRQRIIRPAPRRANPVIAVAMQREPAFEARWPQAIRARGRHAVEADRLIFRLNRAGCFNELHWREIVPIRQCVLLLGWQSHGNCLGYLRTKCSVVVQDNQ